MFTDVAVPLPVYQTFTYRLPEDCQPRLTPGSRVFVPFGRQHLVGVAVRVHDQAGPREIKAVREVVDREPLFSPSLMALAQWIARYYVNPPGEVFRVMLPPALMRRTVEAGFKSREERLWPTRRQRALLRIAERAPAPLTGKQQAVFQELVRLKPPLLLRPLLRHLGCSESVLKSLAAKGLVEMGAMEVERTPWSAPSLALDVTRHALTAEQLRGLQAIEKRVGAARFSSLLLHGVTGSGKTEIYLNAIEGALKQGKSSLILVPEIGLTPQIAGHFRSRFGEQVAILHSALSAGERFDQWRKIRSGWARVVVGTRSAVFAPLQSLGLIFIDEEQDSSYKQEELPRYHAREVALKRGQLEEAVVVLGSATPQLETYYLAVQRGKMHYEPLNARVLDRPLAEVRTVDMRQEFQTHGRATLLSQPLSEAIRNRLRRQEQVLILLNRRGYSSALLCRSCGAVELCQDCSISLTYHQTRNRLVCHYCGYSRAVPGRCRHCGKEYLQLLGEGTEKVEETLRRLFPSAALDRLDRDTVRKKGNVERILGAFSRGETDILIGTQMVAKGHDFHRVTLVGVLSAEQSLRMPDFRAAERTFQLLTQVAGRAGRGNRPGEVIIQTYFPNHYSLKHARTQDYALFFQEEIRYRRHFRYPPFTVLANLVVQDRRPDQAFQLASELAQRLLRQRAQHSSERRLRVLGPAPAALEKLKGQYRFQIVVKTTSRKELHQVLSHTLEDLGQRRSSLKRISIDVDPLNLM